MSQAPFVRADVRALLDMMNAMDRPQLQDLPLDEARNGFRAVEHFMEQPARDLAVIRDLSCPGPAGEIPLRLYDARAERGPGPAIVFFHGGGFVIGNLDSHHSLCTEIAAEMDLPVIAVDYRLAPEHPFPAAPDDAEAAARWVAGSPAELGRQVTGLVFTGDSAGGNLTIVTTQALMTRRAAVPVVLQAPIYPLADDIANDESTREYAEGHFLTRAAMEWFDACYGGKAGDPRLHPAHGRHEGTPPSVVVTAGLDPLRDTGRRYAAMLVNAGVDCLFMEMRGTIHGFTNMRKALPSAQADMKRILSAMKMLLPA